MDLKQKNRAYTKNSYVWVCLATAATFHCAVETWFQNTQTHAGHLLHILTASSQKTAGTCMSPSRPN